MNKNSRSSAGELSTLGRGISIKGRIAGDGDLSIEGNVEGEIAVEGDLRVAEGAEVRASISAANVVIDGLCEGDITAQGSVKAGPGAVLRGNLDAAGFSMQDGAKVSVTLNNDFELPPELARSAR